MKFEEFKEKIKDWGEVYNYNPVVGVSPDYIYMVLDYEDRHNSIFDIHKSERFLLVLNWKLYKNLPENAKGHLFEIVTEFAATKPEDREVEKLFYLKNTSFFTHDYDGYLNFDNCEFYMLNSRDATKGHKTKFTLEEIEEIKKKFNTTLADFELIEVEQFGRI